MGLPMLTPVLGKIHTFIFTYFTLPKLLNFVRDFKPFAIEDVLNMGREAKKRA